MGSCPFLCPVGLSGLILTSSNLSSTLNLRVIFVHIKSDHLSLFRTFLYSLLQQRWTLSFSQTLYSPRSLACHLPAWFTYLLRKQNKTLFLSPFRFPPTLTPPSYYTEIYIYLFALNPFFIAQLTKKVKILFDCIFLALSVMLGTR